MDEMKVLKAARGTDSSGALGTAFLADLLEDWSAHGAQAIAAARKKDPGRYLAICAGLAKGADAPAGPLETLSDEEIEIRYAALVAGLAPGRSGAGDRARDEAPPQPARRLRALAAPG